MHTHSLAVQYPIRYRPNVARYRRNPNRINAVGGWESLGDLFSGLGDLASGAITAGINVAVPQLIQNAVGGTAPTAQSGTAQAAVAAGYTNIGNGVYVNATGQVIDTKLPNQNTNNAANNNKLPSWVLPVGIGVGGLVLFLALRK